MPRHGFGKKKGGYKGPVPGPEGNGEANDHQQTSASQKPAKKPPLTHFLCVPLVTAESRPQLQESLGRFKDDVMKPRRVDAGVAYRDEQEHGPDADLGDGVGVAAAADGEQQAREIPGIPGKGIRPVGTLHLTLGVMSLMSQERLQEAVSLLQSLDLAEMLIGEKSSDPRPTTIECTTEASAQGESGDGPRSKQARSQRPPSETAAQAGETPAQDATVANSAITSSGSTSVLSDPLVISLKSLVSMHPPRKTSILYARPEDPMNRLHPFCDALRALFTKKGLMVEDTRPLKLHATVVNTIYAKAEGRHGKAHRNGRGFGRQGRQSIAGCSTTVETFPGEAPGAPPDTSSGHGPNARAPIRIDATDLLPRYADFLWADGIRVGKIAICKMGAKKIVGEKGDVVDEEYEEVAAAEIKL
ncbi:hypothetical protein MPH_00886 [Macrophomina phaseolina MS6]|uniref:A-kinase anchor protein 7-like phosphoesterase domain-containing protein n=1 Tax=Macrophomina phaseolina (strain MS6) TaxID=1126212 RepID=K2S479_MACPH|nr:hypothetical protein MPH_00886 [Macrophomina phaseolina MS6]